MKPSGRLFFAVFFATAGLVAACSSDGTGPASSVASGGSNGGHTEATGQTGGSSGSTSVVGGSTGAGGAEPAGGRSSAAGSTAIASLPTGGSAGLAGSTASVSAAGRTTAEGGTSAVGGTVAGGTTTLGGTTSPSTRVGGAPASGGSTGTSSWWPSAFDATAVPTPADGKHHAGEACLDCHRNGGKSDPDGGKSDPWFFGGTIYGKAGTNGVGQVQVGIKEGSSFFSAYSARNGNIWMPLGPNSITWANAEIRVRTATGEKAMISFPLDGDCNSCHNSLMPILMP
jgi:hypothetical protein